MNSEYIYLCRLVLAVICFVVASFIFIFIDICLLSKKSKINFKIIEIYHKSIYRFMGLAFVALCILITIFNIKKVIGI